MPSLSALGEFRNSFNNIANERNDVISRNLPFENFALPDTEAAPPEPPPQEEPPAQEEPPVQEEPSAQEEPATPPADTADIPPPETIEAAEPAGVPGGFDFGALLGGASASPINDSINDISAPDNEPPGIDHLFDDFTPPSDEVVLPDIDLPSDDDQLPDLDLPSDDDTLPDVDLPSDEVLPDLDLPSDEGVLPDVDLPSSDDTLPDLDLPSSDDLLPDVDLPSGDDTLPDLDLPSDDDLLSDEDLPSDEGLLSEEDLPSDEGLLSDEDLLSDDDFSVPDDALGLPDETKSAPEDFAAEDFATEDFATEEFPAEKESAPEDFATEDFAIEESPSGAAPAEDFATDDFATEEFPSEATGTQDTPSDGLMTDEELLGEDLGELPDFDLPTEEPAAETRSPDDDRSRRVYNLGGEKQDGTLTTDSFPTDGISDDELFSEEMPDFGDVPLAEDTDLGSESLDTAGEDTGGELDLDNLLSGDNFPGFSETDTPAPTQDDAGFDGSLPDIDIPDDDSGGTAGLGDEFSSDSIDLETEPEMDLKDDFAGDDFVLPVLDDLIDSSKIAPLDEPKPKRGLFGRKKEAPKDPDEIEEIQLEQEDLDRLMETLQGYPLNLRVACEELIAEQVLEPQKLSKLIRFLVNGANVKEVAEFAGQLLGKTIVIPKSFQKSTGAAWEAEKASFAYIFVHNFLPVLRLFAFIAAVGLSIIYLGYRFIYIPHKAETIYQRGYERIFAGEYQRANELFHEAFITHRKKNWFYEYAKGFRDQRRYMLAEAKYDELLRYYPRDKQGVLEYADLQTNFIMNYDKANRILQEQLLDYSPNDFEGLLAAGDNFFAWADSDPSRFFDRYEDARFAYARLLENYGWTSPVVERMMKYFIRVDDLKEVLNLRSWFDARPERRLSPASTAELGGYLLDKQLEEVKGVPNPYVESIESVRAMLLQAVREDPLLPETHYHLSRYYNSLGNVHEERLTLENAIRAFDLADNESVRRRLYNVDTRYRYANLLINNREFFPADEQLVEGITLYEDYVSRNLINVSPQLGQLYALRGDLEYFVKTGNMQAALNNYRISERYGWLPPELQYRMGSAYYQLEEWGNALDYLFRASAELPLNRRLLYALGNTTYQRGDYFAAQGYYNRLLDILDNQRIRLPVTMPNDRPDFLELGERLMMARNNAGVVYEALADQTGNRDSRSRALSLYAESARAWDSITRNPTTMARMSLAETPGAPGVNLGFLNASNAMRPAADYSPEIFVRIDKDVLEPSRWEELAPFGGLIY